MKTERDANAELARTHLRVVKRVEDLDPGTKRWRNKRHNPQRDLDIVLTLLLTVGPVFVACFGVWLVCEIVARWPK